MANKLQTPPALHFLLPFTQVSPTFLLFSQHACVYEWYALFCLQASHNWAHTVLAFQNIIAPLNIVLRASALIFNANGFYCLHVHLKYLSIHQLVDRRLVCSQFSTIAAVDGTNALCSCISFPGHALRGQPDLTLLNSFLKWFINLRLHLWCKGVATITEVPSQHLQLSTCYLTASDAICKEVCDHLNLNLPVYEQGWPLATCVLATQSFLFTDCLPYPLSTEALSFYHGFWAIPYVFSIPILCWLFVL